MTTTQKTFLAFGILAATVFLAATYLPKSTPSVQREVISSMLEESQGWIPESLVPADLAKIRKEADERADSPSKTPADSVFFADVWEKEYALAMNLKYADSDIAQAAAYQLLLSAEKRFDLSSGISDSARAHRGKGLVLFDIADSTEEIVAEFKKAVELDPRDSVSYLRLGIIYSNEGNRPRAIAEYRSAIAADPKFEKAYVNLAGELLSDKDAKAARETFEAAASVCKDFCHVVHKNLGGIKITNRDFTWAVASLETSITEAEKKGYAYRDAYHLKGWALLQLWKYDDAIVALRLSLDSPDASRKELNDWNLISKPYVAALDLSIAYALKKNYSEALKYAEIAKEGDPGGNAEEIIENIRKAMAESSGSGGVPSSK